MLSELGGMQDSDESVSGISMSFGVETRSDDGDELVYRQYIFGYAPEWDKWTFTEFQEKRTPNTRKVADRNWRQSRHIMWGDAETPSVTVPPEVADKLQEATGARSIVLQLPSGGVEENTYEEVYVANE